jgi:hypothetical protein
MNKVLDLFSGIGGFSLALEATGGFETVAFCEFDKHAQEILKLRWPDVPIFDDIRELTEVSTLSTIIVCQKLYQINTKMPEGCTSKVCQYRMSQTSTASPGKQCTLSSSVEELYFVLKDAMEKTTIFTEEDQGHPIMHKTSLNTLYEKVLWAGKHIARNADQIQYLKTAEREYKPTTVTITSLWKLCGYVRNVIINGTNTINPLSGENEEPCKKCDIDIITAGFP